MIKIFADGADIEEIKKLNSNDIVSGFTTNPSLMKIAGVVDYEKFARDALQIIGGKPISFEIFKDDADGIIKQAKKISEWGENVYVKIPITDTKGNGNYEIIKTLSDQAIKLNITAVFTIKQVMLLEKSLNTNTPSVVSIFAGRIADTGIDPTEIMSESVNILSNNQNAELLWASSREVLNIYQAEQIGCDIITVTNDLISKLDLKHKDLEEYSRETVQMFFDDANKAGYSL
jgi:transaldolase